MVMMKVMMFSGWQLGKGLEWSCGVQSVTAGSCWINVLPFHPCWGMLVLGGHYCGVWGQGLGVRRDVGGGGMSCSRIVEQGGVASWRVGETVGDDAVTLLSSVTLSGRSHLQQGVGGSLTF